jgi:hypothetical protein
MVGVTVGVFVIVGVTVGVFVIIGVIVGVIVGVTVGVTEGTGGKQSELVVHTPPVVITTPEGAAIVGPLIPY